MKHLTIAILLTLALVSSSFQIKNINHDLPIKTSAEYVQYIQALNGLATEEDLKSNTKLAQIVDNERISLLNALDNIVLVLVDEVKENNDNVPLLEDIKKITGLDNALRGFNAVNLAGFDQQTLEKKIKDLQNAGKVVHTLEVSQQLVQQFEPHTQRKLQETESDESQSLNEEDSQESIYEAPQNQAHKQIPNKKVNQAQKNSTYILKFFFGLMFIIVSLGALMAIANMDNKKDTLLYAKFIADVGAR